MAGTGAALNVPRTDRTNQPQAETAAAANTDGAGVASVDTKSSLLAQDFPPWKQAICAIYNAEMCQAHEAKKLFTENFASLSRIADGQPTTADLDKKRDYGAAFTKAFGASGVQPWDINVTRSSVDGKNLLNVSVHDSLRDTRYTASYNVDSAETKIEVGTRGPKGSLLDRMLSEPAG